MDTRQAEQLVRQAVTLGMIQYRSMISPADDRMKQREVWRYLQAQGFPRTALDHWVDAGIVHRHKDATKGANSTVWYRKTEIQKAIVAVRTAEAINL